MNRHRREGILFVSQAHGGKVSSKPKQHPRKTLFLARTPKLPDSTERLGLANHKAGSSQPSSVVGFSDTSFCRGIRPVTDHVSHDPDPFPVDVTHAARNDATLAGTDHPTPNPARPGADEGANHPIANEERVTLPLPNAGQEVPQDATILGGKSALRSFGDYELLEEISRGGMGIVYKARQKKLDRIVALKMIKSGKFATAEEVERFYTEAKAAAQLAHPGIVPVIEVGSRLTKHYYSMAYVEGE